MIDSREVENDATEQMEEGPDERCAEDDEASDAGEEIEDITPLEDSAKRWIGGDHSARVKWAWEDFFGYSQLASQDYEEKGDPAMQAFQALSASIQALKALVEEIWPDGAARSAQIQAVFLRWGATYQPLLILYSHAIWEAVDVFRELCRLDDVAPGPLSEETRRLLYESYATVKGGTACTRGLMRALENLVVVGSTNISGNERLDKIVKDLTCGEEGRVRRVLHRLRLRRLDPSKAVAKERLPRLSQLVDEVERAHETLNLSISWQTAYWSALASPMEMTREQDMHVLLTKERLKTWDDLYAWTGGETRQAEKMIEKGAFAAGRADFGAAGVTDVKIVY